MHCPFLEALEAQGYPIRPPRGRSARPAERLAAQELGGGNAMYCFFASREENACLPIRRALEPALVSLTLLSPGSASGAPMKPLPSQRRCARVSKHSLSAVVPQLEERNAAGDAIWSILLPAGAVAAAAQAQAAGWTSVLDPGTLALAPGPGQGSDVWDMDSSSGMGGVTRRLRTWRRPPLHQAALHTRMGWTAAMTQAGQQAPASSIRRFR
jgi:hypothetical protein